ncbi:MGMT family protein [Alkalimarinus coralli]|uniref:MGMT family protein n=1 Tax=Alkalimarinus coralli TaxID=2935863 RepID=UPI00202AC381|nr:MGMT family protein [Alkalimarinus coralli]
MANSDATQSILTVISQIPYGSVTSYGDVAKRAGLPGYARHVGYVLRNLSENTTIPWHRVLNAKGLISFPANSDKYNEQRSRLESEGVSFSATGKVSLSAHPW